MRPVTESDISHSAQAVWKCIFGQPLAGASKGASAGPGRLLVARVDIVGSVPGSVFVVCPWEEARRRAADFFRTEPSGVSETLVQDVFGELANMIGGLIKKHFPHTATLSLPEVRKASGDVVKSPPKAQAVFECGSGSMAVRLV